MEENLQEKTSKGVDQSNDSMDWENANQFEFLSDIGSYFVDRTHTVDHLDQRFDVFENTSLILHSPGGEDSPDRASPLIPYKASDAQVYGPRFCKIYSEFNKFLNDSIDPRRHLMSLCIDYISPFCKWARSSDTQMEWIKDLLLSHESLRVEVRNGIVMVLIYTFASIKATIITSADMFSTLQDNDAGLGIANKFSLKIYNDPFFYLSFLKFIVSGLIDAGICPSNERLSLSKKSRVEKSEKGDESEAFNRIRTRLIGLLDSDDNKTARIVVENINQLWLQGGKVIRNRKFVSALPLLTIDRTIPSFTGIRTRDEDAVIIRQIADVVELEIGANSNNNNNTLAGLNASTARSFSSQSSTAISESNRVTETVLDTDTFPDNLTCFSDQISTASLSTHIPFRQSAIVQSEVVNDITGDSSSQTPIPLIDSYKRPLHALRFDRIAPKEWTLTNTQIYNIETFIEIFKSEKSNVGNNIFFVNETRIPLNINESSLFANITSTCADSVSLEDELRHRRCLITNWQMSSEIDVCQFKDFALLWQNNRNVNSLASLWSGEDAILSECDLTTEHSSLKKRQRLDNEGSAEEQLDDVNCQPQDRSPITNGIIIYERIVMIGIVVRQTSQTSLNNDIWCNVYPNELMENHNISFNQFLINKFPQLNKILKPATEILDISKTNTTPAANENISAKYFSHRKRTSKSVADANSWNVECEFQESCTAPKNATHENGNRDCDFFDGVFQKPPPLVEISNYRDIGMLSESCSVISEKLDSRAQFHDFILCCE